MESVAKALPFPVIKDDVRRVRLRGTTLSVGRLLAHVVWSFEEEQRLHPGSPYDLGCVIRNAVWAYIKDHPSISYHEAEQAIGYAVLRLIEQALRRQAGILEPAFPVDKGEA